MREIHLASIPGVAVSLEGFFAIHPEPIFCAISDHSIVQGLSNEPLLVGMHSNRGHAMHVWFCDVLDLDGNTIFPNPDGLVVGGCDEPPVIIYEGDGVYGSHVFGVLLDLFSRVGIKLHHFVVGRSSQQHMLHVFTGVDLHTERHLSGGVGSQHLASFGVPELHFLVPAAGCEFGSVIAEADIAYRLAMAHVRSHAPLVSVHVPYLDGAVHTCAEQQVTVDGKEPDGCHSFGVSFPRVHVPFGHVAGF